MADNGYAKYSGLAGGGGGIPGSGTVTSVGVTVPSFLAVSGSPVTSSGTIAITLANESANTFLAGPASGGAAAPTFRTIVIADLPFTGTPSSTTYARGDGTWATISAGSGTVTSVSVVSANGLAGTVATATTTPALTLSTTLTTPVIAGNGTALIAATTTGTGSTVVLSASPAFTGDITFGNYHVEPFEFNAGNSGSSLAINFANGSSQAITLTGNATFTFSNPQAGGIYLLKLIQDATGSRTVTWPTVRWSGGSAPTLTTAPTKVDLVSLYWDGTSYFGNATLNY